MRHLNVWQKIGVIASAGWAIFVLVILTQQTATDNQKEIVTGFVPLSKYSPPSKESTPKKSKKDLSQYTDEELMAIANNPTKSRFEDTQTQPNPKSRFVFEDKQPEDDIVTDFSPVEVIPSNNNDTPKQSQEDIKKKSFGLKPLYIRIIVAIVVPVVLFWLLAYFLIFMKSNKFIRHWIAHYPDLLVIVVGGIILSLRLFFPLKGLYRHSPTDYKATLLQVLGIAVVTGVIFYLARRLKKRKDDSQL